jgi:hypothetical protein
MYPEDSIQSLIDNWWVDEKSSELKRGRLIKAFLPHVDQIPKQLTVVGRPDPTDHTKANYKMEPLRVGQSIKRPGLPVAALPSFENEINTVYRAKKRPALIICEGGDAIERMLTLGKPKWQTAPTILVAPCYGANEDGTRAGFNPEFIRRVRQCEYPQFMWDQLPIGGSATESLFRLDHIQPIGRHHDSIEFTNFRLSEQALEILDEWLVWLIRGDFDEDSLLFEFKRDREQFETV